MARIPASLRHLTVGVLFALFALGAAAWSTPAAAQPSPDLSAALFTVDDLPAGWMATNLGDFDLDFDESDPFDPAELNLDPNGECAAALTSFEDFLDDQPPTIQFAAFQRGELGPFIAQIVILLPSDPADSLEDPDAEDFDALTDACEAEVAEDEESDDSLVDLGGSVESTTLPFPEIGDESMAVRVDVSFGILGSSLLTVFSRRGDAISLLFMLADPITATESVGLIEQLAQRTDARLTEVLAGR